MNPRNIHSSMRYNELDETKQLLHGQVLEECFHPPPRIVPASLIEALKQHCDRYAVVLPRSPAWVPSLMCNINVKNDIQVKAYILTDHSKGCCWQWPMMLVAKDYQAGQLINWVRSGDQSHQLGILDNNVNSHFTHLWHTRSHHLTDLIVFIACGHNHGPVSSATCYAFLKEVYKAVGWALNIIAIGSCFVRFILRTLWVSQSSTRSRTRSNSCWNESAQVLE